MKLFGRITDERYRDALLSRLPIQHVPKRMVLQLEPGRDVHLWKCKDLVDPTWRREAQGIGDCVSWGAELACTCLMWRMAAEGTIDFPGRAATESIYGGCRVEVHDGERPMGNSDGAAGSWAADWVSKWGVLLRKDYSEVTGNKDHNLSEYSARRAKDWGYYGNGGKGDKDKLDEVARQYPVQEVTLVRSFTEAAAAISAGYPVTVASSAGFEGKRNSEGIIRINDQWPHQMVFLGVGWTKGGNGYLECFNSWNGSASGPYPGVEDEAIAECSWRVVEDDCNKMFREEDSFAFADIKGMTRKLYDFGTQLLV